MAAEWLLFCVVWFAVSAVVLCCTKVIPAPRWAFKAMDAIYRWASREKDA